MFIGIRNQLLENLLLIKRKIYSSMLLLLEPMAFMNNLDSLLPMN